MGCRSGAGRWTGHLPSNLSAANVGCKDNDGTLKLVFFGAGNCDTANACAVVNTTTVTGVPWSYEPKGPGTTNGTYPISAFIEGGVNVSALNNGIAPCFSNFLAETRSSPSIDAVLIDFAQASLPLCGATVAIQGNDINEVGDPHTFTVTTSQLFAGSSTPADVAHVDVTLTDANGAISDIDEDASTCDEPGDNVDANGQCTIVFTTATTRTVTATRRPTSGGVAHRPHHERYGRQQRSEREEVRGLEDHAQPADRHNGITRTTW